MNFLEEGPIRKLLRETREKGLKDFQDRPLLGILASTPEEVRGFRRGITSALLSSFILGLFLERAVARTPRRGS